MRKIFFIQCVFGLFFMAGVLHAQPLYTLESLNPDSAGFFGCSIAGAGDVNNDGYNDVIVGAEGEEVHSRSHGRAYVFSGNGSLVLHTFSCPEADSVTHRSFGYVVAGAGDLDTDDHGEVMVAECFSTYSYPSDYWGGSRIKAFSGATGQLLYSWGFGSCDIPDQTFGWSASRAGDVDGDGFDDVIVGHGFHHRAYIFSGNGGSGVDTLASPSSETIDGFSCSVSAVHDLDGDGCDDVVVGASKEDGGAEDAGRAYVFSGSNGQVMYTLVSAFPENDGHFGRSVSSAGDMDNDGYEDVIVGAPFEDGGATDAGRAYVFSGGDGGLLFTLESPNPEDSGNFGYSVSGIGDVNGDGFDDVVIGAPYEDGGAVDAGRAYIFNGNGDLLLTLESSTPETEGYYGHSVAGIGDATGDGFPEIAIGAYREDGGAMDAGRVYVYGGAAIPVELTGFAASVENGAVALTWATLSEHENFGFHVYRSHESAGEYMRITEAIIPGAGNSSVRHDYSYSDKNAPPGTTCFYKLADIDFQGHETLHGPVSVLVAPSEFTLLGASPNPFNETTTLKLNLSTESCVCLRIYNLAGELVRTLANEEMKAGVFEIRWDGKDDASRYIPPGVYTYRAQSDGVNQSVKLILIRG